MTKVKLSAVRLTRRAALKTWLAPAGVAAAGLWAAACSDDKQASGMLGSQGPAFDGDPNAGAGNGPATDPTTPTTPTNPAVQPPAAGPTTPPTPSNDPTPAGPADDMNAPPSAMADAGTGPADPMPDAGAMIVDPSTVPWASGGTGSMQGNYPDPFDPGSLTMACALYPAQTIGPCYSSPVMAREDISDGMTGLPLRLSFLVVDNSCHPVPNAEVDIWHTGSNGVYSAYASGICNPDRIDVASQRYCRGKRNTDDTGRVDFSTVFPGWYTGRTIHIHFTVRVGNTEYITSQLYFPDELCDEIMTQTDYAGRGQRDTKNAGDSVLGRSNLSSLDPVMMESTKRADGALHAWKVLVVHS